MREKHPSATRALQACDPETQDEENRRPDGHEKEKDNRTGRLCAEYNRGRNRQRTKSRKPQNQPKNGIPVPSSEDGPSLVVVGHSPLVAHRPGSGCAPCELASNRWVGFPIMVMPSCRESDLASLVCLASIPHGHLHQSLSEGC